VIELEIADLQRRVAKLAARSKYQR